METTDSEESEPEDERVTASKTVSVAYPWTGDGYKKGDVKTFFGCVIGTRGDVQPLVMIMKRLQQDGHRIRLAAHVEFKASIEKQLGEGVWFELEGWHPEELIAAPLDGRVRSFLALYMHKGKYHEWYRLLYKSVWKAINEPWPDGSPFVSNAVEEKFGEQNFRVLSEMRGKISYYNPNFLKKSHQNQPKCMENAVKI